MAAQIHQLKKPPVPEVVRYLEEILQQAREGEVSGVLVLSQDSKGLRYSVAGIEERFTVTGWLFYAMHRLQTDPE